MKVLGALPPYPATPLPCCRPRTLLTPPCLLQAEHNLQRVQHRHRELELKLQLRREKDEQALTTPPDLRPISPDLPRKLRLQLRLIST